MPKSLGRGIPSSLRGTSYMPGWLDGLEGEDEPSIRGAPPANQPKHPKPDPVVHAELNQTTSNNSFEEAMRLPSNEEAGSSQTSNAADANVGN
ncbi:hypothetical protein FNV43_RR00509 [Rhamnella rubrinervis]|uniref:Uncharacterized protein n=1 Tax=Rhamnella rubrinervis TaxID=2594499 RepID=A0A8K0HN09_9ROSA|nr:hypothetical protein FNV43_RR00509 [Rhamnella rubrinervis]